MTSGAVARYAIPKFGKRVVFFTPDYAYGHEMLRGFQRAGKDMGMETLADLRYPLGTSDYTSFFPRVQSLKPDILCMINFGRDLVNAAKQAYDFGITKQVKIVTPVLGSFERRGMPDFSSRDWTMCTAMLLHQLRRSERGNAGCLAASGRRFDRLRQVGKELTLPPHTCRRTL